MSSVSSNEAPSGLLERLRKFRRRRIKKFGKWLIRTLETTLARASLVENKPFAETSEFPHLLEIEKNWEHILAEIQEILKQREAIPTFHEVSPDQKKISKGDNWRTFFLYGFGDPLPKNSKQAPITTRSIEHAEKLQTAWFSILAPGYHIPHHRGVTKGILRYHLGLIIPKDYEKCRIRVGEEIRPWQVGKGFVIDDTFDHEVWNDTDDERVILIVDFDRPMKWWGQMINNLFLSLMRFTAYYQEPKKNLLAIEDRFESAMKRANANMEKLSDND